MSFKMIEKLGSSTEVIATIDRIKTLKEITKKEREIIIEESPNVT